MSAPVRYGSTEAGKYLKLRFGFTFSGRHELEPLEDVLWGMARQTAQDRTNLRYLARQLGSDCDYVIKSLDAIEGGPDHVRHLWEPTERATLHEMAKRIESEERALEALCKALVEAANRLGAA